MSEHHASLYWNRGGRSFGYEEYSRDHVWRFDCGTEVPASAAPAYLGNKTRVDPEEAFVAAVSSCHMLSFLAIAARKRIVVDSYEDAAVGYMDKNAEGRLAITRVVLRPAIRFADAPPPPEQVARLHESAHRECFIASSVRCEVAVESQADA